MSNKSTSQTRSEGSRGGKINDGEFACKCSESRDAELSAGWWVGLDSLMHPRSLSCLCPLTGESFLRRVCDEDDLDLSLDEVCGEA